jgi:hypothetical protein
MSSMRVEFNETKCPILSTIDGYSNADGHADLRKKGTKYYVTTVSLSDLLLRHHAPKVIDFLSIDTEGSEYDILKGFDFDRYTFNVIVCEHNYTTMRENIFSILSANGYVRVFQGRSKFDDWYVPSNHRFVISESRSHGSEKTFLL